MKHWVLVLAVVAIVGCSERSGLGGGSGTGPDGNSSGDGSVIDGDGGSLADGSGGGDTDGGNGNECERIDVQPARVPPNALIVLDRSLSMLSGDRWDPAVNAVNTFVSALDSQVYFGLMTFGAGGTCGAGTVRVQPGENNAAAIASTLSSTSPDGATPTAASLRAAREALANSDRPSYVILVTDGAPNCNSQRDGRANCQCTASGLCGNDQWTYCLDDARSVEAIGELAAAGIPTFVIGYDTSEWESVLNAMAEAGNTGRSYIPVQDQTSLQAALAEIGGSVMSCTYELDRAVSDPRYVRVTLDGTDIRMGDAWELEGQQTVRIVGDACDTLQDGGAHTLTIVVECDIVVVI